MGTLSLEDEGHSSDPRHTLMCEAVELNASLGIRARQCGAQYGIFAQTDIVIQFCDIILLILPIYWAYCQLLYEDLS